MAVFGSHMHFSLTGRVIDVLVTMEGSGHIKNGKIRVKYVITSTHLSRVERHSIARVGRRNEK